MNYISPGKVGQISQEVIDTLNLPIKQGVSVYIGKDNIKHMLSKHPVEFVKYGCYIHDIISTPDYVGINPKDNSIEYVKEFTVNNEFIKIAVRVSNKGKYFARSIYALNKNRVHNFIKKGTLKPLT